MADADWIKIGIGALISLATGVGGTILGAFRAGRSSAEREQEMKEDYTGRINELERTTNAKLASLNGMILSVERESIARDEVIRHEAGEVGNAIRQKVHQVELEARDRVEEMGATIRESIERLGERLEKKIDRAMGLKNE